MPEYKGGKKRQFEKLKKVVSWPGELEECLDVGEGRWKAMDKPW